MQLSSVMQTYSVEERIKNVHKGNVNKRGFNSDKSNIYNGIYDINI